MSRSAPVCPCLGPGHRHPLEQGDAKKITKMFYFGVLTSCTVNVESTLGSLPELSKISSKGNLFLELKET